MYLEPWATKPYNLASRKIFKIVKLRISYRDQKKNITPHIKR